MMMGQDHLDWSDFGKKRIPPIGTRVRLTGTEHVDVGPSSDGAHGAIALTHVNADGMLREVHMLMDKKIPSIGSTQKNHLVWDNNNTHGPGMASLYPRSMECFYSTTQPVDLDTILLHVNSFTCICGSVTDKAKAIIGSSLYCSTQCVPVVHSHIEYEKLYEMHVKDKLTHSATIKQRDRYLNKFNSSKSYAKELEKQLDAALAATRSKDKIRIAELETIVENALELVAPEKKVKMAKSGIALGAQPDKNALHNSHDNLPSAQQLKKKEKNRNARKCSICNKVLKTVPGLGNHMRETKCGNIATKARLKLEQENSNAVQLAEIQYKHHTMLAGYVNDVFQTGIKYIVPATTIYGIVWKYFSA
jgi:hypothetical protein